MDYTKKADLYAEKYGIVDYMVEGNLMTYYEKFSKEETYKAEVNLDTMKETRKLI